MFLKKNNLLIRNAAPSDAETLCRWWNDGSVMAHAGFPLGLGTTAESIRHKLSTDADETGRRLIIEIEHIPSGEMNYRRIDPKTVEIGIKICDPQKQNRGYGRTLLTMLLDALFAMGYRKIILDTNLKNARAQHVYESLGFIKTGVRENAFTDQLGVPQTTVDYALTKQDWMHLQHQQGEKEDGDGGISPLLDRRENEIEAIENNVNNEEA